MPSRSAVPENGQPTPRSDRSVVTPSGSSHCPGRNHRNRNRVSPVPAHEQTGLLRQVLTTCRRRSRGWRILMHNRRALTRAACILPARAVPIETVWGSPWRIRCPDDHRKRGEMCTLLHSMPPKRTNRYTDGVCWQWYSRRQGPHHPWRVKWSVPAHRRMVMRPLMVRVSVFRISVRIRDIVLCPRSGVILGGAGIQSEISSRATPFAALAQLVRAPDCGSGGPPFEPGRRYHLRQCLQGDAGRWDHFPSVTARVILSGHG